MLHCSNTPPKAVEDDEHDRTQIFSASFGRGKSANHKLSLQPC